MKLISEFIIYIHIRKNYREEQIQTISLESLGGRAVRLQIEIIKLYSKNYSVDVYNSSS